MKSERYGTFFHTAFFHLFFVKTSFPPIKHRKLFRGGLLSQRPVLPTRENAALHLPRFVVVYLGRENFAELNLR